MDLQRRGAVQASLQGFETMTASDGRGRIPASRTGFVEIGLTIRPIEIAGRGRITGTGTRSRRIFRGLVVFSSRQAFGYSAK